MSPTMSSTMSSMSAQVSQYAQFYQQLCQTSKRKEPPNNDIVGHKTAKVIKIEEPKVSPDSTPTTPTTSGINPDPTSTSTSTQERVFSNNMSDASTHKCRICGRDTTLTGMRAHTSRYHSMNIKEYVETYGNYRTMLSREVYHRCGLCQEELLLDGDALHKHCNKHKMLMKEYTTQFITSTTERTRSYPTPSQAVKTAATGVVVVAPKQGRKVVKGVWETLADIENILDHFARSLQ